MKLEILYKCLQGWGFARKMKYQLYIPLSHYQVVMNPLSIVYLFVFVLLLVVGVIYISRVVWK